jgi:ferredoxin
LQVQDGGHGQVPAVPAQPIVRDKPELKIKEYRTLGRTGYKVSDIGIGGGPLSNASVLRAALDAGECAGCAGPCEAACPYGVPIQAKLLLAHEDLTP